MTSVARIIIREARKGYSLNCQGVSFTQDGVYKDKTRTWVRNFLAAIDDRATPFISLPGDNPTNPDSWVDLEDAYAYFGGR